MKKKPEVLSDPKDGVKIQYVAIEHLRKWPTNPKKHDIPGIKASIARFGYVAPIAIDEKSGKMVAGHGRLESLLQIKRDVEAYAKLSAKEKKKREGDVPVRPTNILERGGEWYAPVLRGHSFKDELEAEAYLLADNQHTMNSGWNEELLKPTLMKFRDNAQILPAIGWTAAKVHAMLAPPKPEMRQVSFQVRAGLAYKVVVDCKDEAQQAELLERLEKEGFPCRPLIS